VNPQLWWYVARAGGLVAYALLAASTLWGLAVSTRLLGRWPAPGWALDLHRFLGGLALAFTVVHAAGLLLDNYVQFDVFDFLVPFSARWRPAAVAWGVVAVYLLVAVEATSLARRRLPHRLWRRVHVTAFPLLAAATCTWSGPTPTAATRPCWPCSQSPPPPPLSCCSSACCVGLGDASPGARRQRSCRRAADPASSGNPPPEAAGRTTRSAEQSRSGPTLGGRSWTALSPLWMPGGGPGPSAARPPSAA
jgi:Ferric reductase like transmembrane component